ncbi:hypothetical protein [Rhizobium halophilum]|uniref:hypothetical protein n=1 Tax=Rhizobium halophilum TaxID=2846852 RepID=UPI001EFCA116|nr:hypothetical protein [Rhizobium halophilum]MCF6370873.1 hypothetical protein [Rhizobium halophilum]
MSFILQKHQRHVLETVAAYEARIIEIDANIRLRSMSNDTNIGELRLLHRLKEECSGLLYRYQGLNEGFKALVGDASVAAEYRKPRPRLVRDRAVSVAATALINA